MVCYSQLTQRTFLHKGLRIVAKKDTIGNLVWIDLEMTGLILETDVILEIASVITDNNLNVIEEGPTMVIHQSEEKLAAMGKWCKEHHKKSGLTEAVLHSTTTLAFAEEQTFAFIKKHCPEKTGVLSGNSIAQDRNFLQRYMPSVEAYLHYRMIDVTSVKELVKRWYPRSPYVEYKKPEGHRARVDIYESIEELKNYRKYFFIQE